MPYANLSSTLSPADLTSVLTKLNGIKILLSFLIILTKDEHRGLQSLTSDNEPLVTKAQAAPTQLRKFICSRLSPPSRAACNPSP